MARHQKKGKNATLAQDSHKGFRPVSDKGKAPPGTAKVPDSMKHQPTPPGPERHAGKGRHKR